MEKQMKPSRPSKPVDWRAALTPSERKIIERGDRLMAKLKEVNRDRARIINRAIHRAKYQRSHP